MRFQMHGRPLDAGVGIDQSPAFRVVQAPEIGSHALRREDGDAKQGGSADHDERRLSEFHARRIVRRCAVRARRLTDFEIVTSQCWEDWPALVSTLTTTLW